MTTLTAPAPQADPSLNGEPPIHLFRLGCLFVIRVSYWSCRVGNEPRDFNVSQDEIQSRAIASFGSKDLLDPEQNRKVFQQIEKKARHALNRHSRPFPAANAHFVPWEHVGELIAMLDALRSEYQEAVEEFIQRYPARRQAWQAAHPDVPDSAYPSTDALREKFSFRWSCFKVAGAGAASAIEDLEAELAGRELRQEQMAQLKQSLQSECAQFASDYVLAFRSEVAGFCDQVIAAGGEVHGKTLQAIRRKIEDFHAMNVFNDTDTATRLEQLRAQLSGLTGESLKAQPDVAAKLSQACAVLKQQLLDPSAVSKVTGRLRRRVVLD